MLRRSVESTTQSGLFRKHEGYRAVRTRISTRAPTARAYLSMVLNVGRVRTPLSRRHTTLFVVDILAATSSCVMHAAVRAAIRSATRSCNVRSRTSDGECLAARELVTWAQIFGQLVAYARSGKSLGFDHAVVDEAQDLSMPEARFLAALADGKPDGLFFTGDIGQRIFQQPFSWKALGIDVRGRSHALRVNYRTSHQIRARADRIYAVTVETRVMPLGNLTEMTEEERTLVGRWARDPGIPPNRDP